jgi:hypothetical protein
MAFRFAFRVLRKAPAFSAAVIATLAVGIGVNTAVFSAVYALLLKPLPYPAPDRLATVVSRVQSPRGAGEQLSVDGRTFLALRDHATLVDVAASGGSFGVGVNMVAGNRAASVRQGRVSAGYFGVLGVHPSMGREFTADEDRPGAPPVAVLSHALWTRAFEADPAVLGRTIQLRGEPFTVVGIMPASFPGATDVWTPLRPSIGGEGGGTNYSMVARLRPGVAWQQADAEVAGLGSPAARQQFSGEITVTTGLLPL